MYKQVEPMKKAISILVGVCCFLLFSNLSWKGSQPVVNGEMAVSDLLVQLGDPAAPHLPNLEVEGVSVERGRDIVLQGWTESPLGGKSPRVSKHFVCTSCHNIERDEPDLSRVDPMARLKYVNEKGLPFLQGSALYGIVDRRSFYNGDYKKKYGDLVDPARHNLREAIQLCATECSQGRHLDDWELESVLAYFWTLDLKLDDLNLSEKDFQKINRAVSDGESKDAVKQLVKHRYMDGFPATFIDPPADRKAGFSNVGNPETGEMIYESSCLHCHENKRYSFFNLDNSYYSFEYLKKYIPTYSRYSIYNVVRFGTSPKPGKKAYMPHYTKEKMTQQMLEDLRVFIEQKAK